MKRRTFRLTTFLTLLASAFVMFALAAPALAEEAAADAAGYTYTVRVFPGNRGTFAEDPIVYDGLAKNSTVNLYGEDNRGKAKITDEKYVQIGFRESGKDNNQAGSLIGGNGIVRGIDEDKDYVVAYGVKANMVEYTLRFVEYGTGKELAEPETYYGKAGDKPVVAYKYIEGYRPVYLSITGTLQDGKENVWTFQYVALAEGETFNESTGETTTTTTEGTGNTTTNTTQTTGETTINYVEGPGTNTETVVTEPGTTTVVTNQVPGTTTTTVVPGGTTEVVTPGATTETTAPAATTAPAGNEAAPAATETAPATTTEAPATREILDLDTPLAGPETNAQGTRSTNSRTPVSNGAFMLNPSVLAGLGIGLAIALGLLWFFVRRYKNQDDEEVEEEA